MTFNETINQIYNLTIAGYINGEKFTKAEFKDAVKHWFLTGDHFIIEVCLPDGRWLCQINKFTNGEWDYFLPETRKQEDHLYAKLGIIGTAE